MAASTSSYPGHPPPQHKVFLNFRGDEVRTTFISHLEGALKRARINYFIDNDEMRGEELEKLFKTIEESSIAIAVISSRYTESKWCLNELAKIKECVEEKRMKVFPVFYKVTVDSVRDQSGNFGDYFRKTLKDSPPDKKETWEKALKFVTTRLGQPVKEKRYIHSFLCFFYE